ncbi:ArsR/SmtB family transcription factor [Cellulosimicrobium arenosum]|uniref:Helix-turn-helix transcriptional regulator n=1 Tax=Cellulosimicrobium arenosum TaxID=2708133 RepID=A0A927PH80_9MICO|nr:winged helix-turn-helix domain-containing protein [Cellulosimicrobium arenosum]MBD8080630.1 helix-turn-helix transcriptional regulator [Cellulosimicrobium arenosum]
MSTPDHPRGPLVTSDPERMRALAHPLRLRILSLLDDEGEVTATRCAEATGESVASCSFHLRMLAKYGFVEPGERRGKEKPWRAVGQGRQTRFDPAVPGSLPAAAAVGAALLGQETDRVRAWLERSAGEEPGWLLASTLTTASFWATRTELDALSREVEALVDRFAGRSDDPSLRPAGSRPVRLLGVVNADPPAADR